jgi:uncharacterized protein with HEPN domain
MPRLVRELLGDIVEEARFLASEVTKRTQEDFLSDGLSKRAFVRSVEIIGEASKKIPAEVRSLDSSIPWRSVCGMRDRLIHDYSGVDYFIVWDVAVNEAPDLVQKIERLLAALPE